MAAKDDSTVFVRGKLHSPGSNSLKGPGRPLPRHHWRSVVLLCLVFYSQSNVSANAQEKQRLVRVFVALADNAHQGIVPVPKVLGNGDDAARNLYWGAAFGVRTYFKNSQDWKELAVVDNPTPTVLQRIVFQHKQSGTYLVADGYRGREIKTAIEDFFQAAAGSGSAIPEMRTISGQALGLAPNADVVAYVGHDGLMDFQLEKSFAGNGSQKREAIILACASKVYFAGALRQTGAQPLLWTTGLMAPEAYTLKAALDGWIAGESAAAINQRAATAYSTYQKISVASSKGLFASGW